MVLELTLFGVVGLAVGSFLTTVVERIETAESFLLGRSHCPQCRKALSWWELLPLLGYLIVGGACASCRRKIPPLYPAFEAIAGLVFVLMRLATPTPVNYLVLAAELAFVSLLLVLFFADWLNQTFPVTVLGLALLIGLALLVLRYNLGDARGENITSNNLFSFLSLTGFIAPALLGAGVGGVALALLAVPSRGQWMGYGDILVGVLIGLWVGYPFILVALVAAFYLGALVGLWQLAYHRVRRDHRIAFGPFLITGGIIAWGWGKPVLDFVAGWLG